MSERQKLLDAARSAVNLLDAAQSAVDLLTTVLGKEEENGSHGNDTQQQYVVNEDIQHTDSKNTSTGWKTQISAGEAPSRATSMLKTKDDSKLCTNNTSSFKIRRAASVTIATDERMKVSTDIHSRYEKNETDRRFSRTVTPRIPSQVAKVTPQRPIAFGKRDDAFTDGSIGGGGGDTKSRNEGWDHGLNEFFFEQAQASSVLILENAKLRGELYEAKTEIAVLNDEISMKPEVKDEEVQTICAHLFDDRIQGFNELRSDDDDEETDYLTTYSISSPERHYTVPANRSDMIAGKRCSDVYFSRTPASAISTPGTLGRSNVSSSGGASLIRRKLELPKSLKRGDGYLSITSYETLTSDEDESSMTSQGCCPFSCFGRFSGKKSSRE